MTKPAYLIPLALCILAIPAIVAITAKDGTPSRLSQLEPSSGPEIAPPTTAARSLIPVESTPQVVSEPEQPLVSPHTVTTDAAELEPLKLTLDKPEVIQLDRDAVNILVGSDRNLRVVPDTNRTLVLVPKQPGSTYFKALDNDGKVIMQRHVIVGSPQDKYIRIRRACVNGAKDCKQYSVYYCPDMCHEVNVVQGEDRSSPSVPDEAPSNLQNDGVTSNTKTDASSADTLQ